MNIVIALSFISIFMVLIFLPAFAVWPTCLDRTLHCRLCLQRLGVAPGLLRSMRRLAR
jgi:hypothetical protein